MHIYDLTLQQFVGQGKGSEDGTLGLTVILLSRSIMKNCSLLPHWQILEEGKEKKCCRPRWWATI